MSFTMSSVCPLYTLRDICANDFCSVEITQKRYPAEDSNIFLLLISTPIVVLKSKKFC